jgi:glycosyltransferase involved in cell wall biosynthesis
MRFLFVSEFTPRWNSGAEGSLLCIGEALEKRGNQVDYLWKDTNQGYLIHPRFYEYFTLPKLQLRRVEKALAKCSYDVVVISQPYSYLVYETLTARYPGTIFLNRTHGWEQRLAESSSELGWRQVSALRQSLRSLSGRFMNKACRRTASSCTGMIASSHLCANYVHAKYALPEKPIAVIPYGVDASLLSENMKRGTGRLLFVGQYLPRKGSSVLESELPTIAREYPESNITFVVPEESIRTVNRVFRPHFEDRLAIRSWTSRESLSAIYLEHNVLLFPSLFEGFGKVFLEGMAAGLCVVGFREGGLPDIAIHGRDALMCDPGDGRTFGQFVRAALQYPDQTETIGRRAREVARRFTWDRHARETENFCWQLKLGARKESMAS